MGRTPLRLYLSMSSMGTSPGAGLGRDGGRLFIWLDDRLSEGINGHVVPVLPGGGRRLFEPTGLGHVELELVRRLEGRDVTHLRYRVKGA